MNRDLLFSRLEQSMMIIGKEMYHEQIASSTLSPAQNHVLMLVGVKGSIGVKQLAEKLRVTSGAATQHIAALEKSGIVSRKINPNNRREVLVETTKKGKEAFQTVRLTKAMMLKKLFSELDDDELNKLVVLIEKVSHKYIKAEGEAHEEV